MPLRSWVFPELLDGAGARLSFHAADPELVAYHRQVLANELSFRVGFPDEVFEYRNVFLVGDREGSALYDEDGARIDPSAVRRGAYSPTFIRARERIEPPAEFRQVDEPLLFLSKYVRGWGHLLTETVSRLWARRQYRELAEMPAIFAGRDTIEPGHAADLFGHFPGLKIAASREFKPPLKLARVFAPAPSFVNRALAYSGHRAVLQDAAERMLAGKGASPDPRPVYLSRAKLQSFTRSFENEVALENALEARGFRIVHPEGLDIVSQVEVINAHRVFVGVIGSAMHSLLFALRGEEKVLHLLCPYPHKNFPLIDAVVGNESHYVCTVQENESGPQVIDVPTTMAYLRDQGLV